MRDGLTEKLKTPDETRGFQNYITRFEPKIVVVSGRSAGMAWPLGKERVTLGRGPGVDLAFDNPAMSRQHAVLEYADYGFRVRDLGSTNGLRVNGNRKQVCELENGDRLEIAGQVFQLVIDERNESPNTYELTSEV